MSTPEAYPGGYGIRVKDAVRTRLGTIGVRVGPGPVDPQSGAGRWASTNRRGQDAQGTSHRGVDAMSAEAMQHWDGVYATRAPADVSWFQPRPTTSLRLLTALGGPAAGVIDVGAGTSTLADELLALGWSDVTVLDVSAQALAVVTTRLATRRSGVQSVVADLIEWEPQRSYDLWHDRALLHFLVDREDRLQYVQTAARAVRPGGHLVLGVFAEDAPTSCSGLPAARFTTVELEALFAEVFELRHAEREEHLTPAGVVQPFGWVVLRRL